MILEKPWGNLSMNLRLKLTKSYTFNMNAQFATYAYEYMISQFAAGAGKKAGEFYTCLLYTSYTRLLIG